MRYTEIQRICVHLSQSKIFAIDKLAQKIKVKLQHAKFCILQDKKADQHGGVEGYMFIMSVNFKNVSF
jgi:hypothetical protein